ncbi:MAG: DNA-directed RNA polymerase subunit beta, partial [Alphaproteobacteria bacterium]
MSHIFSRHKPTRRTFGHIPTVAPMPNLIEVQKNSYDQFLQAFVPHGERTDTGLQGVFKSVFPIKDMADRSELHFVHYEFEPPKYDVDECQQRGMTFAAPLKVLLQLWIFDVDEDINKRDVRDIKEQTVYMGDMPLMTHNGTFVINGTERVIVSQMHRSPGVFFDHDKGKTHSSGKYLFAARVIPYRGSWLDFEFDAKDLVYVRIDRRRKLPVSTLLYALGMTTEEILSHFYGTVTYTRDAKGWKTPFDADTVYSTKLTRDLINAKTGKKVADTGTKMTPRVVKKLVAAGLSEQLVSSDELVGRYTACDLINEETGEVYIEAGDELTAESIEGLEAAGVVELPTLAIDHIKVGPYIRSTLAADKCSSRDEALLEIYRVMRPGEPPTVDTAQVLFKGLFFDSERYDLSAVGRVKLNARLNFETDDSLRVLRKEDILAVVKTLVELKDGRGEIDDIDHLGNRRVRSVGELMENQYHVGLLRMERAIRERMSSVEIDTVMPHDLINAKPAAAAVREFFGSSQLSQFMDQTNPLSEITHKRRLSALGPGGLTRERAGFEVRDVHPTHYGRICPIETPEGPNIGLINSLATYARINQYGFIESPYRRVVNNRVTDEIVYLSAMEEGKYTIAQANAALDEKGRFGRDLVSCRHNGDFVMAPPDTIDFMDVSPKQLVSVAAALIPFLENDDANRALMGSNMQRQAVPLIQPEAPLIGTGMEEVVARDSGATIIARRSGVVDQVDATRIVVRAEGGVGGMLSVDIYNLLKFQRSNQNTCINQRPLVKV